MHQCMLPLTGSSVHSRTPAPAACRSNGGNRFTVAHHGHMWLRYAAAWSDGIGTIIWNPWCHAPRQAVWAIHGIQGTGRRPVRQCTACRTMSHLPACGNSFTLKSIHYIAHWCANGNAQWCANGNDKRRTMPAHQVAFDRLLGTLVGAFIGVLAFTFAFEVRMSTGRAEVVPPCMQHACMHARPTRVVLLEQSDRGVGLRGAAPQLDGRGSGFRLFRAEAKDCSEGVAAKQAGLKKRRCDEGDAVRQAWPSRSGHK